MVCFPLTSEVADKYLTETNGDWLHAAMYLACIMDDGNVPDGIEIHHALYLLRKAKGLSAPSWDDTNLELRKRGWVL